jgi:HTH-type transcriptional regulator/antitoxin HigA
MAGTKTGTTRVPDTYFTFIRQFPLVPIKGEAHLNAAQEMIDRLLEEDLDEGGQDYLDVLSTLVEGYEKEHHPIPDASEAEVLRLLLESNGLSQKELARSVGMATSTLSAVLNGDRSLTKQQVVALAKRFRISPTAFLPTGEE